MKHDLKTLPEFFRATWIGVKTFEIRRNDRDFKVGDELLLREFDDLPKRYTGRELLVRITYITEWDQKEGVVVMGIAR